jgi:hypothetical protein
MSIIKEAYQRLFPEQQFQHETKVTFTDRFSQYNANIRLYGNTFDLRLSRKWRSVNEEITLGLVQSLLLKVLKKQKNSINIDLYNNFVKSLHVSIPKEQTDPVLHASFERVNASYFYGAVEVPNLAWGGHNKRTLGTYNYKTDTITISMILSHAPAELLDYVMYHELLHKKHKYSNNNNRNLFHSRAFRKDERAFANQELMEQKLAELATGRRKLRHWFFGKLE